MSVSAGETREASRRETKPKPPTAKRVTVVYRDLRELSPYARNARTHTQDQISKLRGSLARFGWTNPMLIADNTMIAGHARLQAAIAMANEGEAIAGNADPWHGPTIDLSHLSKAERRAYVIADNRLAEDAGWDFDILRGEMMDLQIDNFDLALTGFDLGEIGEILVPPGEADEPPERELTQAEEDTLDRAWHRMLIEWQAIMADVRKRTWVTTSFTRGALQVQFLRALMHGREIPRTASLAYTPHRMWTSGNKGSTIDMISLAAKDDEQARSIRNGIRFICGERPSFDHFCGSSLPVHATRAPNDFPADLARDLIDELCRPADAIILDPCHGWGGRMLGFLLSDRAQEYHGIDPSPLSHAGVQSMFDDLSALTPERIKRATLTCEPFETVVLDADHYDFALTSPPYYDTEQYEGEQSSWRIYPSFDAWVAGFYDPLIGNTARALKPHCIFALQVGSQSYPLVKLARDIAGKHGMTHIETRPTGMVNNWAGTDANDGEVIVLLRKG